MEGFTVVLFRFEAKCELGVKLNPDMDPHLPSGNE